LIQKIKELYDYSKYYGRHVYNHRQKALHLLHVYYLSITIDIKRQRFLYKVMIDRDILVIWFLKRIALLFGHMMFTNYIKLYFILIQ